MFYLYGHTVSGVVIAAIDCSFIPKAGKKTFGLDKFWPGTASCNKRGLELSLLSLIDVYSERARTLVATQTPPQLGKGDGATDKYSRIDFYLEQIADCLRKLGDVAYFVADGFYAKTKARAPL